MRIAFVMVLWGAGCSDGSTPDVDSSDTGFCGDAPVMTWDNFGDGFTTENCQSCHASSATNRYGAPEGVVFDTYEETMDQAERILIRVLDDSDTMPPQGGVTPDDMTRLAYWLECHEGI
jgi:uncharacterized membrane protein